MRYFTPIIKLLFRLPCTCSCADTLGGGTGCDDIHTLHIPHLWESLKARDARFGHPCSQARSGAIRGLVSTRLPPLMWHLAYISAACHETLVAVVALCTCVLVYLCTS